MSEEKDRMIIQRIVKKVESELDVIFESEEIDKTERHTWRKMEVTGKRHDYFPVLFENELRDYLMRQAINWHSQRSNSDEGKRISYKETAVVFA